MPETLRPISLSVDEPKPGEFHWVLYERNKSGEWAEIKRGDNACSTYKKALGEGVKAMEDIVEMGKIPRFKPEKASGALEAGEDEPAETTPPKRPSLFGFGPAR